MDNSLIFTHKRRLETRLNELTLRLDALETELDAAKSKDWNESAQESAGDQVLEELGNNGKAEIRAIEAALQRIEEGTYGICTKCGNEIEQPRLELLPHTPFCTKCA